MTEKILAAIKELREKSKRRNFVQTFDLIVNLKDIDLKKPENRFTEDLILPHGKGKEAKIVIFADAIKEEEVGCPVLNSSDIEVLAKNKREAKKLIRKTDFFLAEPKLMPTIGKNLGQFLGPRGKMPKVITGDVKKLVESYKKSIRIRLKESPVIQCAVGNEEMEDEKVAENIKAVLEFLESKLPKGKGNIASVLLKLTMSKPVKLEV
ncbi:MAG: 50S ribosomal protein L1 [Candidatus Aenigmatarchaeota archaeon]|nr:MAG: 50S ribosomal protein L1 [Candidatus Aenigmarchaeota archaeon]